MWPRITVTALLLILLGTSGASADTVYQLVSYTCNQNIDEINVELRTAYNEQGAEMIANKTANSWDPAALVEMRDENTISRLVWIRNRCQLSDGEYEVAISAAPENFNTQGRCGESIGGAQV